MLADLRIENLAVVDRLDARFSPGLNVISGETGAGKSILLQALDLATGGRASSDLVRGECETAVVEARFELAGTVLAEVNERLSARGLPCAEGELIVRRQVSRAGKSRAYINDAAATARSLAEVTSGLVELTGQHDQLGLLRSARHLALVDAYAGHQALLGDVATAVSALRELETRRDELHAAIAHRAERDEFLRFYLSEYDQLEPEPGEDALLQAEAARLGAGQRIREAVATATTLLYEGQRSAYDGIAEARAAIEPLLRIDPQLTETVEELDGLQSAIDDISRRLRKYAQEISNDSRRLEEVEERLHKIHRLCRKHGLTLEQLIDKMEAARRELDELSEAEVRVEEIELQLAKAESTALELARELSQSRAQAAPGLIAATRTHLRDLALERCEFIVQQETDLEAARLLPTGGDVVSFLIAPNPGEPPRPLARIASGGELSRILLALKCAMNRADSVPVQVFDEVDSGIGGGTAEVVGRKVRQLADASQVLCVTHLPQIASFADTHLVVIKEITDDETRTVVRLLDTQEREEEVARMLGGTEITKTTREHAREMLVRARAAG